MSLLCPIARTGFGRPEAQPLAGSAHVWFTEGIDLATGVQAPVPADLAATLTESRAPILGLALDRPRIMGILNVTPDSFSDGGDHLRVAAAVDRAKLMALDADILDIGGESTRPGAEEVPVATEIDRVVPVIRAIRDAGLATPISIDTRKAAVAEAALNAGADMVNDVTAGRFDADMLPLVAQRGVPVCLMHSIADPATMQAQARYDDVIAAVHDHLAERIDAALALGIAKSHIIADPGIGFGKTTQHNVSLLRALALYHGLGVALLVGASRKRFIGALGHAEEAKDRMPGSVAVALFAADRGAQILRVHDTEETSQALHLHLALNKRSA